MVPAILLIVGFAVVGILLLTLLERTVPQTRRAIRARVRKRRRLVAAAGSERRSRAQMDELCPYGWQAQITVYSSARDLPDEAPDPERTRVALDWITLGPEPFRGAERRVWSDSIAHALEGMVADRTTDETLQQIELEALADGAEWPDAF